jgi:uncharacterized protein YyaL (SSP411 family)
MNAERARQTFEAIQANFLTGDNLYLENYPPKPDDRRYAGLWSYSGMLSALTALSRMPDGEVYHSALRQVLAGLETYWDGDAPYPAYDSYVRFDGGGQKYYDDNEWLGWDFIEVYHILGDSFYLDRAKTIFDFVASGWSEAMGGGIYWRENDPETKNACSNGPAAVLALRLYNETHQQTYLDWALRILEWNRRLESPDGVYWDHVKADGSLDKRVYTYNTGTPLHAAALLFQITGDERYLNESRRLAEAAQRYFTQETGFYPDTPWFNAVLLKGYIALYEADPARNTAYIDHIHSNMDYAWAHSRQANGLFSPDWAGKTQLDAPHRWLLDQAAMAELYALLARIKGGDAERENT